MSTNEESHDDAPSDVNKVENASDVSYGQQAKDRERFFLLARNEPLSWEVRPYHTMEAYNNGKAPFTDTPDPVPLSLNPGAGRSISKPTLHRVREVRWLEPLLSVGAG